MAVSEKEFDSIVLYVQKHLEKNGMTECCSYEEWKELNKKGKKKAEGISKEVQEHFEIFWNEFPSTSKFEYKGKKFPGERVLRANKQVCLKLYNDAIQDISKLISTESKALCADHLIDAMKVHVANIKIESYKSGQNRMQYMKSCEVYLRQKAYEAWLGESMPVEMQNVQSVSSSLDI